MAILGLDGHQPLEQPACHRHACTHDNTEFDDGIEDDVEAREMLTVENEHGIVEYAHIAHRVLVGALALVVNHGGGQHPVLVPSLDDAVAQVDVLAVHEEIPVKTSQLLQHTGAAQHIGARQDVDTLRLLVAQVAQVVLGKPGRPREQLRESENLAEGHPGGREGTLALGQEHAVGIHHPGTDGAAFGV